jgi:hypothetical protein
MQDNEMGRACVTYGRQQMYVEVLVGRSERKRPTGKLMSGWEYNIKIDFQEVKSGGMYWINLAQNKDS